VLNLLIDAPKLSPLCYQHTGEVLREPREPPRHRPK
jgi:hypothetical protein